MERFNFQSNQPEFRLWMQKVLPSGSKIIALSVTAWQLMAISAALSMVNGGVSNFNCSETQLFSDEA